MQSKPIAEQEIGRQLLLETAAYAESSVCRRLTLLHYFGEAYNECNCGNCDNCRHPRKKVDATNALLCIIDAIHAVRTPFRSEHIVDVVRGRVTADIKSYGHEKLEEFGCGSEYDGRFLSAAIRQAIIAGYLERDIENFGLISVTPKGEEFLAHRSTFSIVEDNDFSQEEEEAGPTGGTCALDPTLFSMLRGLRAKLAARAKLPPYVIFQDPSLEAMATMYPVTDEELLNIPGVGTGKARRYGKEFLDLIRNYVVDNEIERPEDMRVRSVPNNSLKISLIQAVDRKIALDELAVSKGMDMLKLLDELESIVYSGTKIDISYYVDEVLDEDLQEEIYDYFRNSDTDAMSAALEEFEDEYTEEELRMMRIKFLSEFAN